MFWLFVFGSCLTTSSLGTECFLNHKAVDVDIFFFFRQMVKLLTQTPVLFIRLMIKLLTYTPFLFMRLMITLLTYTPVFFIRLRIKLLTPQTPI